MTSGFALDPGEHEQDLAWWRDRSVLLPITSGVLLACGWLLQLLGVSVPGLLLQSGSLLAGAWTFVPGAVRGLRFRRLGVGLLMTVAATGSVLLGHVAEAAALAFLFSIAEALEDKAMDRARAGLRSLLSLIPDTATLARPSGEVIVPVTDIQQQDLLLVRAGDRVPTDGVVVAGHSSVDTSAITGESIPVEVGPGDQILAGSVNGGGLLRVEATADGRDNSLTTIVRLVEEAQAQKGTQARLADRIARPLIPGVLILAGLVIVFGFLVGDPGRWTERALVVLVAASPCALAIAVPVTVISAIGAASRFGVVIKSGEAFERLGAVRRIAFDKTGTLTRNRPEVVAVHTADGYSRDAVLRTAAAAELGSTHPLAAAIVAAASVDLAPVHDLQELPGQGLAGTVDGHAVRVGSSRWLDPGWLTPAVVRLEKAGMTVVLVQIDGSIAGAIGIRDEARPEAAQAIWMLRAVGVQPTMLTGDNRRTAQALAQHLAIGDVRAELLPQEKAAAVQALTGPGITAMVGDGINDAPALATAGVGIAMGAAGSAAAVESADVAFTGADLRALAVALHHARGGRSIMTQNIVLALAIVVVLLPLALFGVLGLAGVVLAHELAEVIVIGNGIRAARPRRSLTTGRMGR
jgi:cation-transporting ATPase G